MPTRRLGPNRHGKRVHGNVCAGKDDVVECQQADVAAVYGLCSQHMLASHSKIGFVDAGIVEVEVVEEEVHVSLIVGGMGKGKVGGAYANCRWRVSTIRGTHD